MARNTQRKVMLAPRGKHEVNEQTRHRIPRQEEEHYLEEQCRHRLLSVEAVVTVRVEGGYMGQCLLCGASGSVRAHGEAARKALLEQLGTGEGRRKTFSGKVVSIHPECRAAP